MKTESKLCELLTASFSRFRDNIALKSLSPTGAVRFELCYADLLELSLRLVRYLDSGSGPVLVISNKDLTGYAALIACPFAGRCFVPISAQTPQDTIRNLAIEFKISALIGPAQILKSLEDLKVTKAFYDPNTSDWSFSKEEDLKESGRFEQPPLYIALTSGSTSAGKAIAISEQNFTSYLENYGSVDDLNEADKVSQIFNLNFDPAIGEFFYALLRGAQLCVFQNEEVVRFPRLIEQYRLTRWWSTPTTARLLLKLLEAAKHQPFMSVEQSNFVGERLSRAMALRWLAFFPNSKIENTYGPTETTVVNCRSIFSKDAILRSDDDFLSVGKGFGDNQIEITGDDALTVARVGAPGEIVIWGQQVGLGYVDQIPRGYHGNRFRTGDRGFVDSNGDLHILGRIQFEFKVLGERFNHEALSTSICRELGLEQIVLLPHTDLDGQIIGIDAAIDQRKSSQELRVARKNLASIIQGRFWPTRFFYIVRWPLNQNFKMDVQKLAELIEKGEVEKLDEAVP